MNKETKDKISGLFEFIGTFVDLQLKCAYLVFYNRPPNTGDMSSQIQNLKTLSTFETKGFAKRPCHDWISQAFCKRIFCFDLSFLLLKRITPCSDFSSEESALALHSTQNYLYQRKEESE